VTTASRRWYQFSLRTMFVGVTILAIACAALAPTYREYRRKKELEGQQNWGFPWNAKLGTKGIGWAVLSDDNFKGEPTP
jgi:hypothetical protein